MTVKVGINGFGRIGRNVLRASLEKSGLDVEIVAINDLTDANMLAHLLKYDSVHGTLNESVSVDGDYIVVGDRKIKVLAERIRPIALGELGVDIVVESTGRFTARKVQQNI